MRSHHAPNCVQVPPGTEILMNHGGGHINVDYAKLMKMGCRGLIDDVKARLAKETDQKEGFLSVGYHKVTRA